MRTYKNKNQLLFIFLAVGFFVGILYQNIFCMKSIVPYNLFTESALQQYLGLDIITGKYCWYVCKERVLEIGIICVLSCLKWKRTIAVLLVLLYGFLMGVFGVAAVLGLGVKGILFWASCIFPQWIFYSMAYGMMLVYWFHWPQRQWNYVKTIFVILMFSVGMIVEIYVNPILVKGVIRMI